MRELKILITGATGFVGSSLLAAWRLRKGFEVVGSCRTPDDKYANATGDLICVGEHNFSTDWRGSLSGVDVVVHTAALVHQVADDSLATINQYREVNTLATINLARQAIEQGVKRFIYLSTIKVHGEISLPNMPFRFDDCLSPIDAYASSKLEAEQRLLDLAKTTSLEVVIIRPPLIYGPGVRANFLKMLRWVSFGIPLPFGALVNKRSLVSLENLKSLIDVCLDHKNAENKVFLVSDGEDVSIPDLLNRLSLFMSESIRLVPVTPKLLVIAGTLLGRSAQVGRLVNSLQVDISMTKELLSWEPVESMDDGLKSVVDAFLLERR